MCGSVSGLFILLHFQIDFWLSLHQYHIALFIIAFSMSSSVKKKLKPAWIFIGIASDLWINMKTIDILTVFGLPTH